MTAGDIAFAQSIIRGFNTALSAWKAWLKTQPTMTPHDERFVQALDNVADAGKDWVRSKADEYVKG